MAAVSSVAKKDIIPSATAAATTPIDASSKPAAVMTPSSSSSMWRGYWQAARPKAYLAIGLPLILGQVFASIHHEHQVGTWTWWQLAIWTHIWGFLYQVGTL
jgi:hypothetical protein